MRRGRRTARTRAAISSSRITNTAPPLTSTLAVLFVGIWTINPTFFGPVETVIPSLRWALAVVMTLSIVGASLSGVRRGLPILIFISAVILTIALNQTGEISFPIWARVLSIGMFVIFIGSLELPARFKIVCAILGACSTIVVVSLVYGFVAEGSAFRLIGAERNRLYGLTSHPGVLGYLAALTACWHFASAFTVGGSTWLRLLDMALVAFGIAAAFLADSRTAQLAIAASLPCVLFFKSVVQKRLLRHSIWPAWTICCIVTLAFLLYPIALASDLIPKPDTHHQYELSTDGRILIWSHGLSDFSKNPLFGTGIGTRFRTQEAQSLSDGLFYFHSALINYMAQSGLIGAISFIILVFSAPYAILRSARESADLHRAGGYDRMNEKLLIFSISAFVVTIVFASTEAALQNLYPSFLIFFLAIVVPYRIPLTWPLPQRTR